MMDLPLPRAPLADLLAGLQAALADGYTIERELGRGGMATVYLAQDRKHHRQVAIKVLKPELAAALGPERFLREIDTAARLNHPHILPLHGRRRDSSSTSCPTSRANRCETGSLVRNSCRLGTPRKSPGRWRTP